MQQSIQVICKATSLQTTNCIENLSSAKEIDSKISKYTQESRHAIINSLPNKALTSSSSNSLNSTLSFPNVTAKSQLMMHYQLKLSN